MNCPQKSYDIWTPGYTAQSPGLSWTCWYVRLTVTWYSARKYQSSPLGMVSLLWPKHWTTRIWGPFSGTTRNLKLWIRHQPRKRSLQSTTAKCVWEGMRGCKNVPLFLKSCSLEPFCLFIGERSKHFVEVPTIFCALHFRDIKKNSIFKVPAPVLAS